MGVWPPPPALLFFSKQKMKHESRPFVPMAQSRGSSRMTILCVCVCVCVCVCICRGLEMADGGGREGRW